MGVGVHRGGGELAHLSMLFVWGGAPVCAPVHGDGHPALVYGRHFLGLRSLHNIIKNPANAIIPHQVVRV